MKTVEKPTFPIEALEARLGVDDDRSFWQTALSILSDEFIQRYTDESTKRDWAIIVGACSHWLRPHQTRWTAAGGFAYPEGYRGFLPELGWSLILEFRDRHWIPVSKLRNKRLNLFQVALPSRTARHNQAAVHTRWTPGHKTILFGFRKVNEKWECVAASDENSRGKIVLNS